MKKLPFLLAALAASALPPTGAVAAAPPLQQPTTKWVVDYSDTHCTALRSYGSKEKPITLAFRPSPNGNIVRVMVARPGKLFSASHFPVRTTMSSAAAKDSALRFGSADGKLEVIWINFERTALETLRTAGEIAISGSGVIDERFALPGIGSVLKELDKCNADLRQHWNVEEAKAAQLTSTATAIKPLHKLFSNGDYPAQAARERASGATRVMMMVDETGALKDCMVEETSGIASLDAMACIRFLERAKFTPALDASGKPVRSVLAKRIMWVLP